VTVQVRGRRIGPDRLALSLTVSDSGIGFEDLDQAVLYQRFFQVDGSMTRRYGGLDIGLSICRQLGELVGAQLSHESTPGWAAASNRPDPDRGPGAGDFQPGGDRAEALLTGRQEMICSSAVLSL
jgi:signal transduction histidine kinase